MYEFEEKYLDVLHNIEVALVQAYRAHKEMSDWDARDALNALIRTYKAKARGRATPALKLNPLAQTAYDNVKRICDWSLGRATILTEKGKPPKDLPSPKTLEEIIACLQRILNSVEMWQKKGGRRGYYDFVSRLVR